MNWPHRAQIHIWQVKLNRQWDQHKLIRVLSDSELYRQHRLRSQLKQQYFVVARAALRTILGLYLNKNPSALSFVYSPSGKPYLAENELNFNLTHSGDFMLCAVAIERKIGIDLQQEKQYYNRRLALRLLSAQELCQLQLLSDNEQLNYFHQIWVGKEALVKAQGAAWNFSLAKITLPSKDYFYNVALGAPQLGWYLQFLHLFAGYQLAIVTNTIVTEYWFWELQPTGSAVWLHALDANLMSF